MRMDDRCNDHSAVEESEIQRIWETGNDRAPLVVMDRRECQRELTDSNRSSPRPRCEIAARDRHDDSRTTARLRAARARQPGGKRQQESPAA
jgi:hypothetical protein